MSVDERGGGGRQQDDGGGGGEIDDEIDDEELADTVEKSVERGDVSLNRGTRAMLATGAIGGADVALGVFALLLVKHATGSEVAGSIAFGVGFIALLLAHSELFTENFLLPLLAVVAERARPVAILRLWILTGLANMVGGWLFLGLIMTGFPELGKTANEVAFRYIALGITWRAFAIAMVGGSVITLMTWMQRRAETEGGRLVAAVTAAFVLAMGSLNHAVVASLECFAALQAGAHFGYAAWAGMFAWATLGNIVGGTGIVGVLRLIQAGPAQIKARN